jgi:single-strand DNA-binding protein
MLKNSVRLIGYVGQDPEVRHLSNDTSVANFTLATTESYKNREGEKVENTQWHRCVGWRHIAVLCEKYVSKGTYLAIDGKIEYRSYESKTGEKRYVTEIVVSEMEFLGKNGKKEETEVNDTVEEDYDNNDGGDLPF